MWAIVPYKGPLRGKQRLGHHLSCNQRASLIQAMLHDVLAALSAAEKIQEILLVSPTYDDLIHRFDRKVHWFQDRTNNLRDALSVATCFVRDEFKGDSVFIVPADLPIIASDDLNQAIDGHQNITLIPDSRRIGTNGLICSPPTLIEYVFDGCSFEPHLQIARATGFQPRIVHNRAFSHDVDYFSDLMAVTQLAPCSITSQLIRRERLLEPTTSNNLSNVYA